MLADGMKRVERAGYAPLLCVHDEIVCEVKQGVGSLEEFNHILVSNPGWAANCPVAVEGWRGARYRK